MHLDHEGLNHNSPSNGDEEDDEDDEEWVGEDDDLLNELGVGGSRSGSAQGTGSTAASAGLAGGATLVGEKRKRRAV